MGLVTLKRVLCLLLGLSFIWVEAVQRVSSLDCESLLQTSKQASGGSVASPNLGTPTASLSGSTAAPAASAATPASASGAASGASGAAGGSPASASGAAATPTSASGAGAGSPASASGSAAPASTSGSAAAPQKEAAAASGSDKMMDVLVPSKAYTILTRPTRKTPKCPEPENADKYGAVQTSHAKNLNFDAISAGKLAVEKAKGDLAAFEFNTRPLINQAKSGSSAPVPESTETPDLAIAAWKAKIASKAAPAQATKAASTVAPVTAPAQATGSAAATPSNSAAPAVVASGSTASSTASAVEK